LDLGIEHGDGEIKFSIEEYPPGRGLERVVASWVFHRPRRLQLDEEAFDFSTGDMIRLLFSYRYTPELLRSLFAEQGLEVVTQWTINSAEEAIFLVRAQRIE
jgi:hypothetical protein